MILRDSIDQPGEFHQEPAVTDLQRIEQQFSFPGLLDEDQVFRNLATQSLPAGMPLVKLIQYAVGQDDGLGFFERLDEETAGLVQDQRMKGAGESTLPWRNVC